MSERVVTVRFQDGDGGVYISIHGEMRLVEMLATAYLLLQKSIDKGAERLGESVWMLRDLLVSVKRAADDEAPNAIVEAKN